MSEETLLDRAGRNINHAVSTLQNPTGDEFDFNIAGYCLQQAFELMLKHVLEIKGFVYPKTHDIAVLLQALDSANLFFPEEIDEKLRMMSGTITLLETTTRYIKGSFKTKREVESVLRFADEVYRFLGGQPFGVYTPGKLQSSAITPISFN